MFYLARVTRIHPERHSVDVTIMSTQRPLAGVYVLSTDINGTDHGYNNLVEPTFQPLNVFDQKNTEKRDIYAVVIFSQETPLVIGFLYPEVTQMHFEAPNFKVDRHGSDTYETINGEADAELYHPSGSYVRFAQNLDHVDLTAKDYDKLWKIINNTEKIVGYKILIEHKDGQGNVSLDGYIQIAPDTGFITIWSKTEVDVIAPEIRLLGSTQVEVVSPDIDLDGPVDIDGDVVIHGNLTVTGNIYCGGVVYAKAFVTT